MTHNQRHFLQALGGLFIILMAAATAASAAIGVTFIPPDRWGEPDADLGFGGGVVEDFEDVVLATGLLVEIADGAGEFSGIGSPTLPAVFDPVNGDPWGDSFTTGIWDGSSVMVNTETNQSIYYGSADWRAVQFHLPEGVTWFAVATQQVTGNHTLKVNGQPVGRLLGLGMPLGAGRNGVMVVSNDDPLAPIVSVSFGGGGDAFVVDHVVFEPADTVPVRQEQWGGIKTLFR
jgi:hypothetical protein